MLYNAAAAAAAKSLQSCLTLCDPRDGSPPHLVGHASSRVEAKDSIILSSRDM